MREIFSQIDRTDTSFIGDRKEYSGNLLKNVPGFKAGQPRKLFMYQSDHEHKRLNLDLLQRLLYKNEDYPHRFMAQIIQVDDHILLPLPWEVTQETGRRISDICERKS